MSGTTLDQRRESPIVEISLLLCEAVIHGLRTIAFCKSRKLCELVAAYARENLTAAAPHKAHLVKVYRGGYSPAERRQLEHQLHSGGITALAATNALELGIDVGDLDMTLHLGFPGSVASLWQQAGRAGRRSQSSLSIYVGFDGPLDQHFMAHPTELLDRPIECVQLDPHNSLVLHSHLLCAAKELPLLLLLPSGGGPDGDLFGPTQAAAAATTLSDAGLLGKGPTDPAHPMSLLPGPMSQSLCGPGLTGGPGSAAAAAEGLCCVPLHYTGPVPNPASEISLRTIDPQRFIIYNSAEDRVLEEVESNMAFYNIYDGAVYLYQGRTYLCTGLNLEARVAFVKPATVRWYTKVRDVTDIHVTGARLAYPTAHAALAAIEARRGAAAAATAAGGDQQQQQQQADVQQAGSGKDEGEGAAAAAAASCQVAVKVEQDVQDIAEQQQQQQQPQMAPPAPVPSKQECSAMAEPPTAAAAAAEAALSSYPQQQQQQQELTPPPGSGVCCGGSGVCESCVITVRFMGYFRVHQGSGAIFDAIDLFLPDAHYHTQACYLRLPPSARRACESAGLDFREGVHAASHALLNVLPLFMVCNSNDVGTECDNPYDTRFRPERLLLYDKHPGGIGLVAQATPLLPELLSRALGLVSSCPCSYPKGCPRCVQHLDCKNYNAVLSKRAALVVLRAALEQEQGRVAQQQQQQQDEQG